MKESVPISVVKTAKGAQIISPAHQSEESYKVVHDIYVVGVGQNQRRVGFEEVLELFFGPEFKREITVDQYDKFMKNQKFFTQICLKLQNLHKEKNYPLSLLQEYLKPHLVRDVKDLFEDFRDKRITIHQLRARMLEKQKLVTYKTVDDCKEFLPKEMFENQEETKDHQRG